MLSAIRPEELKGDLSFLASDTLQGRFTPSPGLDVAAEFIGLEPGGDQDFFQLAHMVDRHMPRAKTAISLIGENGTLFTGKAIGQRRCCGIAGQRLRAAATQLKDQATSQATLAISARPESQFLWRIDLGRTNGKNS